MVKRYTTGVDESRTVGFDLDSVIRAIVDVGGNYPAVVRFLVEAKRADVLKAASEGSSSADGSQESALLVFDAIPGAGGSPFKRIRDVAEVEKEIAEAAAERKKEEKKSFWSKVNPVSWFRKDEDGGEDAEIDAFSDPDDSGDAGDSDAPSFDGDEE